MQFFKYYLENILKYDFINRFNYNNISYIPSLEKVILCFEYKNPTYKQILNSLLALELISKSKADLLTLKKSNVSLKLRAGSPVGCKVTLKKLKMLDFISTLFLILIPQDKNFVINFSTKNYTKSLSFDFKSLFLFKELKDHYSVLKDLSNLSIVLITDSKNISEFVFFMKSLKVKFFM